MSHSGNVFPTYTAKDKKYLELLHKALTKKDPESLNKVREKLSTLPEPVMIHLIASAFPDTDAKLHADALKVFCREDRALGETWCKKLQAKKYLSEELLHQNGGKTSVFDQYLGAICYSAFRDNNVNRQQRNKFVLLSSDYQNYHALLVKCKNLIIKLGSGWTDAAQKDFNTAINTLGNNFWSLGHFQAGSMLHQLKKNCGNDSELQKELNDRMLREFIKAEAVIDAEQSLQIFSTLRGEMTLSEFLQKTFGVSTIEKVKNILKTQFTTEDFKIISDAAFSEVVASLEEVVQGQDLENESDDEDDNDIAQMTEQLKKIKAGSTNIELLIKQSIFSKDTSSTSQPDSDQKHEENESYTMKNSQSG